jgi:hypothetical protein
MQRFQILNLKSFPYFTTGNSSMLGQHQAQAAAFAMRLDRPIPNYQNTKIPDQAIAKFVLVTYSRRRNLKFEIYNLCRRLLCLKSWAAMI